MAHTPGPWEAKKARWHYAIDCEAALIAKTCGYVESETENANARLIAAAPDLLAACKAARSIVSDTRFTYIYDQIDAAIAKAEPKA